MGEREELDIPFCGDRVNQIERNGALRQADDQEERHNSTETAGQ